MEKSVLDRTAVSAAVATTREQFVAVIAHLDPEAAAATMANEGWSALEMLRHVWSWNWAIGRCFDDWGGARDWIAPIFADWTYKDDPNFTVVNARMLAEIGPLSLAETCASLEASYTRYAEMLDRLSDAELHEVGNPPWFGQRISRLALIHEFAEHDQGHFAEISAARR